MRILVLGGTQFLGRAFVELAAQSDHKVTIFHRGITGSVPNGPIEVIYGDRRTDLARLATRSWDCLLDTSGYQPNIVEQTVRTLRDNVGHYTFVSTISVYRNLSRSELRENAPTLRPVDASPEVEYGIEKAASERIVEQAFRGRCLIVRPGILIGPNDPTDRFTYWIARISKGGNILVPETADHLIQLIDVRDAANWILRCTCDEVTGIFNLVGPVEQTTFTSLLRSLLDLINPEAQLKSVPEEILLAVGLNDWNILPLWIPRRDILYSGFFCIDTRKAQAKGLKLRPLVNTANDILSWSMTNEKHTLKCGLDPALEAAIISKVDGAKF